MCEFLEVSAGAEGAAGTGDNDGTNGGVFLRLFEG
ncbi:hypothetical protein N602_31580 [Mycobacterium avium subsp. hominissuis 10-5606]|nr:hypothetical protein N602_31580 [Mycobacterium avium subsp. hominissuis 10-5606]